MPAYPIDTDQIVITASRVPQSEAQTPASVTIIDQRRIDRLDEPLVLALLRLTPSAAITSIGPSGSLTEVRIRGSEANHTLFFLDGIKINDPASGDAPRFELLNADLASRMEVVRGPQSALWGSDAIGGVLAVNGLDDAPGYGAKAEAGSFGFRRASGSAAVNSATASLSGAIGWQRATGIDSWGRSRRRQGRLSQLLGPGARYFCAKPHGTRRRLGYRADRTQRVRRLPLELPFDHTDTLDSSRNRLLAGRALGGIRE